jgi:hypothetical protein
MKPYIEVRIPVDALREMTHEQLDSLKSSVLADGLWENQEGPLTINGTDYLGVQLPNGFFLGIEKGGYAHS